MASILDLHRDIHTGIHVHLHIYNVMNIHIYNVPNMINVKRDRNYAESVHLISHILLTGILCALCVRAHVDS